MDKEKLKRNIIKLSFCPGGDFGGYCMDWIVQDMDNKTLSLVYLIMDPFLTAVKEERNLDIEDEDESEFSFKADKNVVEIYTSLKDVAGMLYGCEIIINNDKINARIDIDDGYLENCVNNKEEKEIKFNWKKEF